MNFCLSDQVLTGAIAGAVTITLAYIAWQRAVASRTTTKKVTTSDADRHKPPNG